MASQQIEDYLPHCRPMPPRMPREELEPYRAQGNAWLIETYKVHPGVAVEKVTHNGVDAFWHRPANAEPGHVILYTHGGGYMWCSAETHAGLISRLSAESRLTTLALDYKHAPYHPFPSQVNEALELYLWLLDLGYAPEKIAVVGDSAGGGLALSLLLAIRNAGKPLPACIAMASAWLDCTNSGESIDWVTVDPCVSREGLETCVEAFLQGQDPRDPLASPLFGDMAGMPPMLIQAGSREQLLSDSTRLAAKADAAGVPVQLEVYDGCFHLWHWLVPEAPESDACFASTAEFVRRHMGAAPA